MGVDWKIGWPPFTKHTDPETANMDGSTAWTVLNPLQSNFKLDCPQMQLFVIVAFHTCFPCTIDPVVVWLIAMSFNTHSQFPENNHHPRHSNHKINEFYIYIYVRQLIEWESLDVITALSCFNLNAQFSYLNHFPSSRFKVCLTIVLRPNVMK